MLKTKSNKHRAHISKLLSLRGRESKLSSRLIQRIIIVVAFGDEALKMFLRIVAVGTRPKMLEGVKVASDVFIWAFALQTKSYKVHSCLLKFSIHWTEVGRVVEVGLQELLFIHDCFDRLQFFLGLSKGTFGISQANLRLAPLVDSRLENPMRCLMPP